MLDDFGLVIYLERLKMWGTDFILKVKDLFTLSESQIYVKDLRKVMTYNEKKCQYPKNYDQIVEFGGIIKKKIVMENL
ncbi:MAG: hypothetical protein ACR5KW_03385 [Wolbachia sp.]